MLCADRIQTRAWRERAKPPSASLATRDTFYKNVKPRGFGAASASLSDGNSANYRCFLRGGTIAVKSGTELSSVAREFGGELCILRRVGRERQAYLHSRLFCSCSGAHTKETARKQRERERESEWIYRERNCFCHAARSTFGSDYLERHDAITKLKYVADVWKWPTPAACGAWPI